MTIREEFEKAFEQGQFSKNSYFGKMRSPQTGYLYQHAKVALWAARWMAEKLAELGDLAPIEMECDETRHTVFAVETDKIRQLAKELQ